MEEERTQPRRVPTSDQDFNYMIVDTRWGKVDVPNELRKALEKEERKVIIHKGERYINESKEPVIATQDIVVYEKKIMWDLLSFYTQDIRLGQLTKDQETYVIYHLDLAGDCLHSNLTESFIIALSRAISVLETSQSRQGFLRWILTTLRKLTKIEGLQEEKKKRGLFGRTPKEE